MKEMLLFVSRQQDAFDMSPWEKGDINLNIALAKLPF